jgi:antitoxin component YwqK of YwqJK toxin-antitoxin module
MKGPPGAERPVGFSGIWRQWYRNGGLYLEDSYVNGVQHGYHAVFSWQGRKEEEGRYAGGKRDGQWTWWDENGDVAAEATFKDGREWQGSFQIRVHRLGCCRIIVTYAEGERSGPYGMWHLGERVEEAWYEHGHRVGKELMWHRCDNGAAVPGGKAREGQYVNGERTGVWKWWARDGKPIGEGYYKEGKEWNGVFVRWDSEAGGMPLCHGYEYALEYYLNGTRVTREVYERARQKEGMSTTSTSGPGTMRMP